MWGIFYRKNYHKKVKLYEQQVFEKALMWEIFTGKIITKKTKWYEQHAFFNRHFCEKRGITVENFCYSENYRKKQNYMNNRFFERALMWEIFTGKITTKKQNGMNNTLFKQALLWEISVKEKKNNNNQQCEEFFTGKITTQTKWYEQQAFQTGNNVRNLC